MSYTALVIETVIVQYTAHVLGRKTSHNQIIKQIVNL